MRSDILDIFQWREDTGPSQGLRLLCRLPPILQTGFNLQGRPLGLALPLADCTVMQTAALLLGCLGAVQSHSDRLVEFSSRTFARLDQLKPATTPTTLVPAIGSKGHMIAESDMPRWSLDPSGGQLRPDANADLCLSALDLNETAAVALRQCARSSGKGTPSSQEQQWEWDSSRQQLRSVMASSALCVTGTPIGIVHTLSLARCDSLDNGTRWGSSFNGSQGALVLDLRGASLVLHPDSVHPGARGVVARLEPLFVGGGPDAEQVLVGCFGWMLDLALGFTGQPDQQLPIVNPESPQWSTGNATYADLRLLIRELRTAAAARGMRRLKVGVLFVGWGQLYNIASDFAARHPEIYINGGTQLAHGLAWSMAADTYPYASHPRGVSAGSSFFELFGAQWAALSTFLGLDAVVLRDGMSGFARGGRCGPFGDAASRNATENQRWIDGVRELFKQTKTAAPQTTVLGYSQQGSAVGVYRVGLSDVEQLVADGYIDAWVDQSWAGAWEDVPTRYAKTHGWTYQLMFILVRRAQIEGGNRNRPSSAAPCRHYILHGAFDAYEGFDTIHMVPGKLAWGIRAYTLAALVRPGGEHIFADGHYVSWANSYSYVSGSITNPLDDDSYLDRPTGLLTNTDIEWISRLLDSADALVASAPRALGPTVLYDRNGLAEIMKQCPDDNANEWLDEQLGLVLKYGVPLAKIARIEDGVAPAEHADGVFLSVPSASSVSSELVANLTALATGGSPIVLLGRCDKIAPDLLELAGVKCQPESRNPPFYGQAAFKDRNGDSINSTVSIGTRYKISVRAGTGGETLASLIGAGGNGDTIMARKGTVTYAQLNDYRPPVSARLQVLNYGAGIPHYLLATDNDWGSLRLVNGVDPTQPIALHAWRGAVGGDPGVRARITVLAGNVEANNCGSETPCSVPTQLGPRSVTVNLDTGVGGVRRWLLRSLDKPSMTRVLDSSAGRVTFPINLSAASSEMYTLDPLDCSFE